MVLDTVVSTKSVDTLVFKLVEESLSQVLTSLDFKNIQAGIIPPLTTWEQLSELVHTYNEEFNEADLEAWFISIQSFSHDSRDRGTVTQYQQLHRVLIEGFVWNRNLRDSYIQSRTKGENLAQTLEKNKGLMDSRFDESMNIEVNYQFLSLSEVYLHKINTSLDVIVTLTEPAGRI